MISKTQLRDYEVSIWTLQDSFITVLKASNLEQRGEIEDPQMILKDDGENTLSFKIPMYLYDGENFVENPIWYNTINGIVVASLRKIKVIFNKHTEDEAIYEFIITSVVESHEGYQKYCDVSCEGLAFHELGKQGYKITLSGDEYDLDLKKWNESGSTTNKPINNLNYWANKVFEDTNWEYVVQMDWSAYGGNRKTTKVYEDNEEIEKYRNVEAKESNRYNLSQNIAEAFQVFCRYEYEHDDTYHIVGRKVIFYNNFIKENEGIIDLTYKYNTQQLKRTMDGTDLVTKMFVRSLKDTNMPSGEVSIMDTNYNQALEDYILNFDYLYSIGTISQEQYNEILQYKNELHRLNSELIPLEEQLIELNNEKIEKEAKLETAKNKIKIAQENAGSAAAMLESVGDNGIVTLDATTAEVLSLLKDDDTEFYYCHLYKKGVIRETIKIYKTFNSLNPALSGEITQFVVENDKAGNPYIIKNLPENTNNIVYATFKYDAMLGYDKVVKDYQKTVKINEELVENLDEELNNENTGIIKQITDIEESIKNKNDEKKVLIRDFEKLMGAALREGFWQPEDEYVNYSDNYEETFTSISNAFNNNIVSFAWDDELFEDEQKLYYYYGPSLEKRYYPIIKLNIGDNTWKNKQLVFVYTLSGTDGTDKICNKNYMSLGSKMILCYVNDGTNITPALLLLDAEQASDEQLADMRASGRVSVLTHTFDANGNIEETETRIIELTGENNWIIKPPTAEEIENEQNDMAADHSNLSIVYPRFQINSNKVKDPEIDIFIKDENNNVLENYKDFYILYRESKYYITLKYETIINYGTNYRINFNISSAAKAIYFDALQILKENSYPKVSYEIELSSLNKDFTHTAYNRLGQIAHINDAEFKFENTMGYISEVDLDLAQPWKDKVVIKNYKTKFEDLFSTIVAQTEQMKKNSYIFGAVSNAFGANGMLSDYLVDGVLKRFYPILQNNASNILMEGLTNVAHSYKVVASDIAKVDKHFKELEEYAQETQETLSNFLDDYTDTMSDVEQAILDANSSGIPAIYSGTMKRDTIWPNSRGKENDLYIIVGNPNTYFLYTNRWVEHTFKIGDIYYDTSTGIQYIFTGDDFEQVSYNTQVLEGVGNPNNYNNISLIGDRYIDSNTNYNYIKTSTGWQRVDEKIQGAYLDINATTGKIALKAQHNITIQSGGAIDLNGQAISLLAAGNNSAISLVTALNGQAANNVFTLDKDGITIGTAGKFHASSAQEVYIGTDISSASGANYLWMKRNTNNNTSSLDFYTSGIFTVSGGIVRIQAGDSNVTDYIKMEPISQNDSTRQITMATSGNLTIAAGGELTIGSNAQNSNNPAKLKLVTDGKFFAMGAQEVAIATAKKRVLNSITNELEDKPDGSYIWMHRVTENNVTNEYLDITTTGTFRMYGAEEFCVSTGSNLNISSYIRMHTENNVKTLEIATKDKFSAYGGAEVLIATGDTDNLGSFIRMSKDNSNESHLEIFTQDKIEAVGAEIMLSTAKKQALNPITNELEDIDEPDGSYIWMHKDDNGNKFLDIGTTGELYFNSNNFIVDTRSSNTNVIFQVGSTAGTDLLQFTSNGNLNVTGNITANSFILGADASIPEDKIEGLSNKLNGLRNDIDATNAISAVISYAKSSSGVLNNNNLPSDITDITAWNSAPVTTDDNKPFLWTKTVTTYASGNTSTSYSISYKGRDGTNDGKYVTNITPLYYLKNNNTTPSKPSSEVTSISTNSGSWTISIPTYTNNYYYFRCEQYKWNDNNFTWSTPYIDYGITYAASTATSASTEATSAATTVEPFTYDGLSYGTTWGGKTYGVTLSNSSTAKPMLIGSNSGITIAKSATSSDGAALAIDSSGIALYGKTIHLKTNSNNTTDVVTLDDKGITIGTDGKIEVGSSNFVVTNTTTNGDVAFRLGSSSNPYLKYTVGTGLEVKGNITATSGSIGDWKIQNGELLGGSLSISNGVISGTGIRLYTTSTTSVIYFYKDNVARMVFSPYTTYTDNTGVTREGNMIAINREYISNNSTQYEQCFAFHPKNGLTIKGNITATSGSIGDWQISSTSNTDNTAGHYFTNSLYTHATDNSTYDYEIGMTKDGGSQSVAFYVGRINKGSSWKWDDNTTGHEWQFYVLKNGNLYAKNASIDGTLLVGQANSNNYLSYNSSGLTVKGNITATSGSIGDWKIQNGELLGGTLNISNGVISGTGIRLCTTSTTSVIYFYKDNVERMIFSPYTTRSVNGESVEDNMITINRKYKDANNNILYEPCLTFHGTNGLTVKGNITATSGSLGNMEISSGLTIKNEGYLRWSTISYTNSGLYVGPSGIKYCKVTNNISQWFSITPELFNVAHYKISTNDQGQLHETVLSEISMMRDDGKDTIDIYSDNDVEISANKGNIALEGKIILDDTLYGYTNERSTQYRIYVTNGVKPTTATFNNGAERVLWINLAGSFINDGDLQYKTPTITWWKIKEN